MRFGSKAATTERKAPSPLIAQLREQVSRVQRGASSVRAELKKMDSPWMRIGFAALTTTGGGASGTIEVFLGDGLLGKGVAVGGGLLLVIIGANVDGAPGGAIAAIGAGILAHQSGEGIKKAAQFFGIGKLAA